MKFNLNDIAARIRDNLKNPASKIEGSFSMDNVQAASVEMAHLYAMEILPIPDNYALDTAQGEYLDRKGADLQEPRKEGESDGAYRVRLLEKVQKPLTGGNENQYVYWAKQVPGVGNAKCIGCWNGPGTVKVVLLSDISGAPEEDILKAVREHIDTERLIGADVTVAAATPMDITVDATLRISAGYQSETVQASVAELLAEYLTGIAFRDNAALSYYKVGELMFHADGVEDVSDYTVNGNKESLTAAVDEFFQLREVMIHVAS